MPIPLEMLHERALQLIESEQYAAALGLGQRLVEQRHVGGFLVLAIAHDALGDAAAALRTLEQGVHAVPDESLLWHLLGRQYAAHGRPRDALRAFDRAAARADGRGWIEIDRATALLDVGDYDEALAALDRIRSDDQVPAFAILRVRAEALLNLDRRADAIVACDAALAGLAHADNSDMPAETRAIGRQRLTELRDRAARGSE